MKRGGQRELPRSPKAHGYSPWMELELGEETDSHRSGWPELRPRLLGADRCHQITELLAVQRRERGGLPEAAGVFHLFATWPSPNRLGCGERRSQTVGHTHGCRRGLAGGAAESKHRVRALGACRPCVREDARALADGIREKNVPVDFRRRRLFNGTSLLRQPRRRRRHRRRRLHVAKVNKRRAVGSVVVETGGAWPAGGARTKAEGRVPVHGRTTGDVGSNGCGASRDISGLAAALTADGTCGGALHSVGSVEDEHPIRRRQAF
eukprot:CAMPEP_0174854224 /NCGR_PEP_ID=MMETSP1114-20130205/30439_1 /TAXON_ID=312471 /ORGANISM="Neobodo designis, Strain CCAP 1951/1" /LENGTH=264 /DNA_ID=CAMNT_0016088907 /DNA_START=314 /DNA_END=1109 /DNA_ORIENTATION=-